MHLVEPAEDYDGIKKEPFESPGPLQERVARVACHPSILGNICKDPSIFNLS